VLVAVTHEGIKLNKPFPKEGSVYDYVYVLEGNSWKQWMDVVPLQKLNDDLQYQDITITTLDVVRYTYLINTFVQNQVPVLLVGPTGTGKSVYMKDYLMNRLDKSSWVYMTFSFSAQTSVNMTQVQHSLNRISMFLGAHWLTSFDLSQLCVLQA
jgi:dynein heavy chain, axonemal